MQGTGGNNGAQGPNGPQGVQGTAGGSTGLDIASLHTSGLQGTAMFITMVQGGSGVRPLYGTTSPNPGGEQNFFYTANDDELTLENLKIDGSATLNGSTITSWPSGGSAITVQDEGSSLATAASTINFVGAGVVASGTSATKTITIGGDANQNTFSNVAVSGQSTVAADTTTDTLTLVAGSNVTITTDTTTDSVTINSSGGGGGGYSTITAVGTNADLQLVFHTGGTALQADASNGLTFNPSSDELKVGGDGTFGGDGTAASWINTGSVASGIKSYMTGGTAAGVPIGRLSSEWSGSTWNVMNWTPGGVAISGWLTTSDYIVCSQDVDAVNFNSTSDESLKENVETIENALSKVINMRGVNFNWKENSQPGTGVIAQEIETVLPHVVTENNEGIKHVQYGNIVGTLIEAIKEQQRQIEALQEISHAPIEAGGATELLGLINDIESRLNLLEE